jgi:hypothetical protein
VICEATRDDLQKLVTFLYTGNVAFDSAEAAEHFRSLLLRLRLEKPKSLTIESLFPPQQPFQQQQDKREQQASMTPSNLALEQQHQEQQQQQPLQQQQPQKVQQTSSWNSVQLQQHLKVVPDTTPSMTLQQPQQSGWQTRSKEETFPCLMTDLLGGVTETLPELVWLT